MGALLTIDISLLLPIELILPTRSVLALQVRISVSHLLSVLPLPPSPPTPPRFKTTGGEGGRECESTTQRWRCRSYRKNGTIVSRSWSNCTPGVNVCRVSILSSTPCTDARVKKSRATVAIKIPCPMTPIRPDRNIDQGGGGRGRR